MQTQAATKPAYLFICDTGGLYDTRIPDWHKAAPLRADYRRTFRDIKTVAQFKATLRNGGFAWPGGYPLFLLASDGGALCFKCGRNEFRNIADAIAAKDSSGWRVIACDIAHGEEGDKTTCDHCGADIV